MVKKIGLELTRLGWERVRKMRRVRRMGRMRMMRRLKKD